MNTTWVILAILAAIVLFAVVIYNRLVRQRNLVREGWSGIDVQLRRRTDLVPNLIETVKAYASHERTVFEDVAAKRAGSTPPTMSRARRRPSRRCRARCENCLRWRRPIPS